MTEVLPIGERWATDEQDDGFLAVDEHYLVDGLCEHCSDHEPLGEHEQALVTALAELHHLDAARAWDPAKHPRGPGGKFRSIVDRLKESIERHHRGEGDGHPFDGYSREQLRRVAKARGIELKRGEDRDSIAEKLLGHLTPKTTTKRVEGRDRIADVTPDTVPRGPSYPTDHQLTAIAKLQGFDGKPQLTDRAGLDKAINDGWVELWRGVEHYPGRDSAGIPPKRARQIIDELKDGPWEPGGGIYGNGAYTSVRRFTAEIYRGAKPAQRDDYTVEGLEGGADGGLVRMAVDPKARVVDFQDLLDEMEADQRVSPFGDDPFRLSVLSDPGRYAAAKGYDVIRVSGPEYNDGAYYPDGEVNADQYVILNRTVLMIQREDPA